MNGCPAEKAAVAVLLILGAGLLALHPKRTYRLVAHRTGWHDR